jgi:hypothetical protein
MEGEVDRTVSKAGTLDLNTLEGAARARLKGIGAGPPTGDAAPTPPPPETAVRGLIKDVGERVQATVEESQKQP